MIKLLDDKLVRAIFNLARAYKAYDDAVPEVGFGWTFEEFLKMACMNSGLSMDDQTEIFNRIPENMRK